MLPYFQQKSNLWYSASCCWRGLHNIEFQVNNVELAGHEEEFWPIISLFLFWVNYHVIVVCWIIFSQKRNYSDNKQLMSFVGMKVRYDDKTILYVKTFPGITGPLLCSKISQYFFPFPLSIKHFCHQSSNLVIWKICSSPKNMSTLSIWVLSITQMSLLLSHINTFFHWTVFVWADIFSLICVTPNCAVARVRLVSGLHIFRGRVHHQWSLVITKHGHMDMGDTGHCRSVCYPPSQAV